MHNINPFTSIIIVNFNGKTDLEECLPSVLKQNYPNFEVVLVDNDSSDDSIAFVKINYQSIKIIQNNKNYGYAKGNNIGFQSTSGKYIVVLNPDTVVEKNWLLELVKTMEENPKTGVCQSKILLYDNSNAINTDGNMINFLGFGWAGNHTKKDLHETKIKSVSYPSGCSMILRRSTLDEVGLFDEDLFMYHDDLDLGIRMRLMGYDVLCNPKSVAYHKYIFVKNKRKYYFLERNRWVILMKIYEKKTLFGFLPALLFMEFGLLAISIKEGWFYGKISSYKYLFKNLTLIKIKRNIIQKNRKIDDKELLKIMHPMIDFEEINNPILTHIVNPLLSIYFKWIKRILGYG
ncbi:MAG: glycosyltransferase family 2 protein [Methanosarcinales archaeon]|nr:glycosyltransferase family 2 protein [Methanosarcinales archaeon]